MFGYMTELDKVEEDDSQIQEFEVEGHDYISLLYNLMDEFLFRFVTEPFVVCRRVKILELDSEAFKIRVQGSAYLVLQFSTKCICQPRISRVH